MRKIIKKANSKWFLLFLFGLFSVGVQGQWNEYEGECIKVFTGNVDGIVWETDPNDPNYEYPVFVLIPVYEYDCGPTWDPYGGGGAYGPLTGGGSSSGGSGGSGGGGTGGGSGTGAPAAPPTPPAECAILVCSGLLIDRPYLAPNRETCKCDKLPRPWYPDNDGDGYHAGLPYFEVFWSIESPGIYWKKTTLGEDCDDDDSLVTTNCYKEWFRDNDGDNYEGATEYSAQKPISPGKWFEGKSLGIDCDDANPNVYKLNKCSKCEVEPVNGVCDDCDTSAADLKKMFDLTDTKATQLANILNKHAGKFGIDTLEELQHFLAQAGKETSGFKNLVNENLDYRVKNLLDTWPSRFSQTDTTKLDPDDYAHNPEKLGEYVYGGRNGNTQPGDGYLYRGRGAIQITGRTHYTNFSNYYKDNFDSSVDLLKNPNLISSNLEIAIISGLWYFQTEVMDKLPPIDANTPVLKITNKINRREEPKKKEERRKIFDEKVKPNAKCN